MATDATMTEAEIEKAAEDELKTLSPQDRELVADVMAQHPALTVAKTLKALKEAGM